MAAKSRDFYIVHQDKDMLVVDKPPGLLAVPIPGSNVKNLETLVAEFVARQGNTISTVHRIDRFTSGLMVFAKKERTYRYLRNLFQSQEVKRTYLAVVRGRPEPAEGALVHHMKRVRDGFRNIVVPSGDPEATKARLWYRTKKHLNDTTLLEVELDTGLKNQIRVQFAEIGHPIVGDRHYAPEEEQEPLINRQALHAWKLEFPHPSTKQIVTFKAKKPRDFRGLLKALR